MHWKTFAGGVVVGAVTIVGGWLVVTKLSSNDLQPLPQLLSTPAPKPLLKYTFSALESYQSELSQIELKEVMFEEDGLTAYLGIYQTNNKHMSLQVMVPKNATPSAGFPTILMIRGFADAAMYQTGVGTKNAARFFANHGFVTVAPDFLGYGISDDAPVDTLEARLERPQQLLDLLASLKTLKFVDTQKVGIWGHSNGGQISLSLLEITKKPYPTVLWAPVSKPFPYSILYYADELNDQGKDMRKIISKFEDKYDVFDYSIDRYLDNIAGPISLHQGTADDAVPVTWSNNLTKVLKDKQKDITYFIYPGSDHNMRPDWQKVADRSLEFFQHYLLSN